MGLELQFGSVNSNKLLHWIPLAGRNNSQKCTRCKRYVLYPAFLHLVIDRKCFPEEYLLVCWMIVLTVLVSGTQYLQGFFTL